MAGSTPADTRPAGRGIGIPARMRWPLSVMVVAILIFIFYKWLFDQLGENAQSFVNAWFSPSSINEALVWAICALGLNIVVGYAGLLDLGFVAFWAIGGYTAGWLMAAPFNWEWDFGLMSAG